MVTPPPANRKMHIIRIFGTNADDDILTNMWADVERIEHATNAYNPESTDGNWQGNLINVKWHDDPSADDYLVDGPASRKQTILKLCPPDTVDFDNPTEWIPISIIDSMKAMREDQGRVLRFLNNNENVTNNSRTAEIRRVVHYDTSIDSEVNDAISNDPTIKVFVLPASRYDEYVKAEDTKDAGQYALVEYIKWIKTQTALRIQGDGGAQGQQVRVLSQYLIDNSDDPDGTENHGSTDINPPYRLDPYQNIININFGGQRDLIVFGYANTVGTGINQPHIWLGIRGGKPVIVRSGSLYGMSVLKTGDGSDADTPPDPIGEQVAVDGTDTEGDGLAVIATESFYDGEEITQIFAGDTGVKTLDITGGKGIDYFKNNNINLFDKLYKRASNGDYFRIDELDAGAIPKTYGLYNKNDDKTGSVTLEGLHPQVIEDTVVTLPGQWHNAGIIEGGGKHYFVVTDFSAPFGDGTFITEDVEIIDGDTFVTAHTHGYAPECTSSIRIFDWTGTEITEPIIWGTTLGSSAVATEGSFFKITVQERRSFPELGPFYIGKELVGTVGGLGDFYWPDNWPPSGSITNNGILQLYPSPDDLKETGTPIDLL